MGKNNARKPPHEILGVDKGADLVTLATAYNQQVRRCERQEQEGDELAGLRIRRLQEAFEILARQQGFQPENSGNIGREERCDRAERFLSRAERLEQFKLRARVGQLITRWNQHMRFLHESPHIIHEIKKEKGGNFARLKAIFRGRDEDLMLWAAERYLRSGGENAHNLLSAREISSALFSFKTVIESNSMEEINQDYFQLVEAAVEQRVSRAGQALEIMKKQLSSMDFLVS